MSRIHAHGLLFVFGKTVVLTQEFEYANTTVAYPQSNVNTIININNNNNNNDNSNT